MSSDIRDIARLHARAFPGFFLTELGQPFLRSYYRMVLRYRNRVFVVAEEQGRPIGFAAGFVAPSEFYSGMRRQAYRLALPLVPAVLRNPKATLRILSRSRRGASPTEGAKAAELASLAVDPPASGGGVGGALAMEFVRRARMNGARAIYLTTAALENERVNRFYRSLEFQIHSRFVTHDQRAMIEYRLDLGETGASNAGG